jgi:hypothetical protein
VGIWYATREEVKRRLDSKATARDNDQVDDAIEQSSRDVERYMHRLFYPFTGTRKFDWPNFQYARPWRLWLDQDEVVTVSELRSNGVVIAPSDYFLEPVNDGPPFNRIDLNIGSSATFGGGSTHQQSIEMDGVFAGCALVERSVGALGTAIADTTSTTITVSDGRIGVGHLLRVDSERMNVIDRAAVDTGVTISTDLAARANATLVDTGDGSVFAAGEVITINAERMLIEDVAGDSLVVRRAWDGSVLADHTATDPIFASRLLTVERGAVGTTPAAHLLAAPVRKHIVPGPVHTLTIAQAMSTLLQETSGYTIRTGVGDRAVPVTTSPLKALWEQTYDTHGRKVRIRGV